MQLLFLFLAGKSSNPVHSLVLFGVLAYCFVGSDDAFSAV